MNCQENKFMDKTKIHIRKSIRLREYDYSQSGYYFVTICTDKKQQLFGEIKNSKMILNEAGIILEDNIIKTSNRYENIEIDYYQIMTDHLHIIIIINETPNKQNNVVAIHELPDELHNEQNKKNVEPIHELPNELHNKQNKTKNVVAIHELPDELHNELPKNKNQYLEPINIQRRKMLLPKVIGFLKMNSSKQINLFRGTTKSPVWQRNYYEHIIRNDKELYETRKYIRNNPIRWEEKIV